MTNPSHSVSLFLSPPATAAEVTQLEVSAGKVRFGSGSGYFSPNPERERCVRFRLLPNPEPERGFRFGSAFERVRTWAKFGLLGAPKSGETVREGMNGIFLRLDPGSDIQKWFSALDKVRITEYGTREITSLNRLPNFDPGAYQFYPEVRVTVRFKFERGLEGANAVFGSGIGRTVNLNVAFGPVRFRFGPISEPNLASTT
ncbi:hypothetical protein C8R46DRAFT_1028517 [Mycena filopes]|nr:hypothetical protein C8R46DRAFT_1028517 [Mycena filopes]